MVSSKDGAILGLALLLCVAIVVLILGAIKIVDVNDKLNRIDKTIDNKIFCPDGNTNPNCQLTPNLNLAIPPNSTEYSAAIALFGCNLLACLEVTFKTDPTKPAILPNGVSLVLQILYKQKIIALVCSTPNASWCVMRGTQNENEWKQDLMIQQTTSPKFEGKVHQGFLNIYNDIQPQLVDVLLKQDPANYLYIIGHSLGSALSQMLLSDSSFYLPFASKSTYIFGAPRIGDPGFARSQIGLNIYKFSNTADLVPQIPTPVSPNFVGDPNDVFLYEDNQKLEIRFNVNRSSFYQNHALQTYLKFLTQIQ